MPYDIRKRGTKYCVIKRDDGRTMGCHASKPKAERQRRALYAGEQRTQDAQQMAIKVFETLGLNEVRKARSSAEGSSVSATMDNGNNDIYWSWNITMPSATGAWSSANVGEWQVSEKEEEKRTGWDGVLAVIGHPTSDKRLLIPGEVSNRELPLPFLVQTVTEEGHKGAEVAGRIEKVTHIPIGDVSEEMLARFNLKDIREGAVVVYAEGTLDGSDHEVDVIRMIENGAGVSIDMPPDRVAPFDPETLEELDPKDLDFETLIFGDVLTGIGGKIAAATVVSIPAFEEASVMLVEDHALVASAYGIRLKRDALTASAAGLAPLKPPTSWFYMEEPNEPTPLTVTEDGRVYGHLALWDQCHAAFASCERPPRSASEYSYFHVGQIETEEGDMINVGRVTVGEAGRAKGGHASLVLGRQGALEHYDETGCVGAFVRAKDGVYGIWLSGAVRSDAPAERVRDLRANPPSGDWRDYELVAVLSVPVPGFPVPRAAEARMVASAEGKEEVAALVATAYTEPVLADELSVENMDELLGKPLDEAIIGWTFPCSAAAEPIDIPTYRRKMAELSERRREILDGAA